MRFSIIMPAYNAACSVEESFKNLNEIDFPKDDFEVLIVNDGSTDNTEAKCNENIQKYSNLNIRLINKKNGGVSSARNEGIRSAKGEYLIFLDADDRLDKYCLKELDAFAKKHKIDFILYSIVRSSNKARHWRETYLKDREIYSIDKDYYLPITTINFAIKNQFEKNFTFDESLSIHEDEEYAARILIKVRQWGYARDAIYIYNNDNAESVMNTKINPFFSFEKTLKAHKKLLEDSIERFGIIDKYIQCLILNDLSWKLRSNVLFSRNEADRAIQEGKIGKLLQSFDADLIIRHPQIDKFHKQYLLRLGNFKPKLRFDGLKLIYEIGNIKEQVKENTIYFSSIKNNNERLIFSGFFKNYITDYLEEDKVNIIAICDNVSFLCKKRKTYYSYHRCNTKTNNFIGFEFTVPQKAKKIEYYVSIENRVYKINKFAYKDYPEGRDLLIRKQSLYAIFDKEESCFYINPPKESILRAFYKEIIEYSNGICTKGLKTLLFLKSNVFSKRINLFQDREGVFDNAYLEFNKKREENNGEKLYYIYHSEQDKKRLISEKNVPVSALVKFKTLKHQILYLLASKIYTSFVDESFFNPINLNFYRKTYSSLFSPEIIYLQHGVLHAKTIRYAAEFLNIDKVFISTKIEYDYFQELGFTKQQLVIQPMARLHGQRKNLHCTHLHKILYLPSWRSYLCNHDRISNTWTTNKEKFLKSSLYKGISKLIGSEQYKKLLSKGVSIDIQLHPIIANMSEYLTKSSDCKIIADARIEDYDLVITDYSSVVYDAVYYGKPIVYFCPDYEEFKGGLNLYCDTVVPIENGFGPLYKTAEELLDALFNFDFEIFSKNYSKKYDVFIN